MIARAQMVSGEGLVVKGGDPSYRQGDHARCAFGRVAPGSWMTDETKGQFGSGAYCDEPYSYKSVEMYLAAFGWFWDQVHTSH